MRKTFTGDFKAKVVLEILKEEKSISQIAAEHGVHPNQLQTWKKEAVTGLAEILADGRRKDTEKEALELQVQELYMQLGEVTSKLNWLKKKSGIKLE
jgi:putative transposase